MHALPVTPTLLDGQQHFRGLERAEGGTGGWMAFVCCGCCSTISAQEERGRTVTSSACMRGYEQNCRQLAHPPFKTSCVSWQINNAHKITTRSSPPGILPYRRFLVGTTRPITFASGILARPASHIDITGRPAALRRFGKGRGRDWWLDGIRLLWLLQHDFGAREGGPLPAVPA